MVKVGFIFPGQGSQVVGMGQGVYETSAVAKDIFNKAKDILGYDLAKLCFEGPEEELMRTKFSQPAIFVTSIAVLEALKEKKPNIEPSVCLGLSLGEYTALVAAGALSFEDGLKLVKVRAEAMERAATQAGGAMASVIGSDDETCQSVCDGIDGVWVANLNSPGQTVISGTVEGVDAAMEAFQSKGVKRVIKLNVSGAFHSALMIPAKEELAAMVSTVPVAAPVVSLIQNFTASAETDPEQIKNNLLEQLTGTVRWSESFACAVQAGTQNFLELGAGTVLKGLARRIDKTATVTSVHTCGEIEEAIHALQ